MKLMLCLLLAALVQPALAAMSHGRALGTTAAFDQQQRLWIVRSEPVDKNAHVVLERSDDNGKTWQSAIRVTTQPEPVSADGENRPSIPHGWARSRARTDIRPAARELRFLECSPPRNWRDRELGTSSPDIMRL